MPPKSAEKEIEAKAKADAEAKVKADLVRMAVNAEIEISTTHGKSRRRAGMAFGPVPVRVRFADLNEKQQKAIRGDTLLNIQMAESPSGADTTEAG